MDLEKLTPGERIIGVSGIVLFVLSFFTWFGAEDARTGTEFATASGWNGFLGVIGMLLALALVVYVVLKAAGVALPTTNWPLIVLIVGIVVFLCILIKVLAGVSVEVRGVEVPDELYDTSRKFPAWIGLVAAAGVAAGAVLNFLGARAAGGTTRPSTGPATGPTV